MALCLLLIIRALSFRLLSVSSTVAFPWSEVTCPESSPSPSSLPLDSPLSGPSSHPPLSVSDTTERLEGPGYTGYNAYKPNWLLLTWIRCNPLQQSSG